MSTAPATTTAKTKVVIVNRLGDEFNLFKVGPCVTFITDADIYAKVAAGRTYSGAVDWVREELSEDQHVVVHTLNYTVMNCFSSEDAKRLFHLVHVGKMVPFFNQNTPDGMAFLENLKTLKPGEVVAKANIGY